MYPSCCAAAMPIPPALGPDDLAGLVFIYPPRGAALHLHAGAAERRPRGDRRTRATFTVVAVARRVRWAVTVDAPWLIVPTGAQRHRRRRRPLCGRAAPRCARAPAIGALSVGAAVVQRDPGAADSDDRRRSAVRRAGRRSSARPGVADRRRRDRRRSRRRRPHERSRNRRPAATRAARSPLSRRRGRQRLLRHRDLAVQPVAIAAAVLLRIQPETGGEAAWPVRIPRASRGAPCAPPIFESLTAGAFSTLIESDRAGRRRSDDALGRHRLRRARRSPPSSRRRRPGIWPRDRRPATSRCSTCCRTRPDRRRKHRALPAAGAAAADRSRLHDRAARAADDSGRLASGPSSPAPTCRVWSPRRSRSSSSARCT